MVFRFTEFINFLKIFFYSQEKALYYVQETSVVAGNGGVKGRRTVLSEQKVCADAEENER